MNELEHIEQLLLKAERELFNENYKSVESLSNHALEHCNKDNQDPMILYRIAFLIFQAGNFEKAEKIWKDAIDESISKNDKSTQAFILHNIATIKANLGHITEANYLWEESLSIKEKIDDKKGIAATLNNLAWVYKLEENYKEETSLLIRATKLFIEFSMWNEVADNIIKLSESDKENKLSYLIQAFYISIKVYIEPRDFLYILTNIIETIGIENKYSKYFVALSILINKDFENEEVIRVTQQLLLAVALAQSINEENIKQWFETNELGNLKALLENLQKAFEELNQNKEWLFDPNIL
ncbi:MAG: tetratricopeptide repeat protein [Candidatus Sericytochromatia bacterium]